MRFLRRGGARPRRRWSWWRFGLMLVSLIPVAYAVAVITLGTEYMVGPHGAVVINPASVDRNHQDVSFTSHADATVIRGWLFRSSGRRGLSAILVPGLDGNRDQYEEPSMPITQHLLAQGFDVLVIDLRAEGASGGTFITFGTKEAGDVVAAFDFMRANGYQPRHMLVFGTSLGGASVLEAAPELGSVGAIVADSAYAELRPVVEARLAFITNLPMVLSGPIIWWGCFISGTNIDLRPVDAVASLPQRAFLFIHGSDDTLVPVAQAYQLRAASQDSKSELALFASGHAGAYASDPGRYLSVLDSFLTSQLGVPVGMAA